MPKLARHPMTAALRFPAIRLSVGRLSWVCAVGVFDWSVVLWGYHLLFPAGRSGARVPGESCAPACSAPPLCPSDSHKSASLGDK